jgi:hypothetical protein
LGNDDQGKLASKHGILSDLFYTSLFFPLSCEMSPYLKGCKLKAGRRRMKARLDGANNKHAMLINRVAKQPL